MKRFWRQRVTRASAALLSVVIAVAASGCGGAATQKSVKAEANAICYRAQQSARTLAGSGSGAEGAGYYSHMAKIVGNEADGLKALAQPSGNRALFELFVHGVGKAADDWKKLSAASANADKAAVAHFTSILQALPVSTYASAYGLRECAASHGSGVG
jgi:hypothetical protein